MRKSAAADDSCAQCHPGEERGGHVSGEIDYEIPKKISSAGGWAGKKKKTVSCRTCHLLHGSAEKEMLVRRKDNICEDCHSSNPSTKQVGSGMDSHPVGVSAAADVFRKSLPDGTKLTPGIEKKVICLTCHKTHKSEAKESLLVAANEAGELCIHCHSRMGGKGIKKENNGNHPHVAWTERGKDDRQGCNICHRTHNGARDLFAEPDKSHILYRPMDKSELCVECHENIAAFGESDGRKKGTHPLDVWANVRKLVPAEDGSMARREKVSCRSCHLSHGTEPGYSSLKEHRSFACLLCHPGQNSLDQDVEPSGNHPVYVGPLPDPAPDSLLLAGGTKGEYGELICRTCHGVHEAQKDTPLLLEATSRKDFCIECHPYKALLFGTKHDLKRSGPNTPNKFSELPAESGSCGVCHRTHGWARDPGQGHDTVTRMCTGCHYEGSSVADPVGPHSHPTGAGMEGKANLHGLPLFSSDGKRSASGNVACSTCHSVHRETLPRSVSASDISGRKSEGNFLRLPYSGTNFLCLNCHDEKRSINGTPHDLDRQMRAAADAKTKQIKDQGACAHCHSPHKGSAEMMWAKEVQGTGNTISTLCTSCHFKRNEEGEELRLLSHPVNVSMSAGMETDLRLFDSQGSESAGGLLTCATCHDVHQRTKAMDVEFAGAPLSISSHTEEDMAVSSPGLSDATAVCLNCHKEKQVVLGSLHDMRKGVCGGCHAPHPKDENLMWATGLQEDQDAVSSACLGCHGSVSREGRLFGKTYGHPVGISPKADPSTRLPLFDESGRMRAYGMMTCATCHDSHSEHPGSEVNSTAKSKKFGRVYGSPDSLCIMCHPRKKNIIGTVHDISKTSPEHENILGQTTSEKGICSACHVPHFAQGKAALWATEFGPGENLPERYCLGCHGEDGTAKKKVPKHLVHPKTKVTTAEIVSAESDDEPKPFGKFLKDVLVGPEEPQRQGARIYKERTMKLVDRLSLTRKSPPLLPLYDSDGKPGSSGILSCPSCHDIHNGEAEVRRLIFKEDSEREKMEQNLLRPSFVDDATRLCGDCHGPYRLKVFWGFHEEARGKYGNRIYSSPMPRRF
jgi:predicted CXXCH cytochrome family protein